MSGRPPPPLPPTAADAARTSSTALNRPVRSCDTPDHDARLALGCRYKRHHAAADLLADRVGQPLQVARRHLAQIARGEPDAVHLLHLGRAAAGGQLALQLGDLALQLPAILQQRGDTLRRLGRAGPQRAGDIVQPVLRLRHHRLGERAGDRLDAAHAGGDRALRQDLEVADIAGAPHMRAAAQLDGIGGLVALAARPSRRRAPRRRISRRTAPSRPFPPRRPASSAASSPRRSRGRARSPRLPPRRCRRRSAGAAARCRSAAGRARSGCPSG